VVEFRHKRQELSLAELEKLSKADNYSCQGLADAVGVQDLLIWLVIDRKSSFFTLLFPFITKQNLKIYGTARGGTAFAT
jgi:hypothetical protein